MAGRCHYRGGVPAPRVPSTLLEALGLGDDDDHFYERVRAQHGREVVSVAAALMRTREELLRDLDEARLLERVPVLQASIDRRNPYVDPLSYLQVELLRRLRAGREEARSPLLATITGIAAGMRNTG